MPRHLVAALLAALTIIAPAAHACTLNPIPTARSVRVVLFLGQARTDTVLVGSGGVTVTQGAGHYGAGRSREVYGQIVGVERLGDAWQAILPRGTREVVLVPWDYAADCRPVFWGRSARWLVPGTSGLYRGTLREPRFWVGGRPTLDVFAPEFEPYPTAEGLTRALRMFVRPDAPLPDMLSAAEALDFYSALATDSMAWAQPDTAVAAARRWADAHPGLAGRLPAATVLRQLVRDAERRRFRQRTSPLAGTYRFEVTFASGDTVVLFARSEGNLLDGLSVLTRDDLSRGIGGPPIGYHLLTYFRTRVDEFPATYIGPDRSGYLVALFAPLIETPDSAVYRGEADFLRVIRQIDTRPSVGSFVAELLRYPQPSPGDTTPSGRRRFPLAPVDLLRDSASYFAPGSFTAFPDGRVRFEWLGRRGDTTVVAIRGERISTETLAVRGLP